MTAVTVSAGAFRRTKEFIMSGRVLLEQDELKAVLLLPGWSYSVNQVQLQDIQAFLFPAVGDYDPEGIVVSSSSVTTSSSGNAEFSISALKVELMLGRVSGMAIYSNKTVGGYVKPLVAWSKFGVSGLDYTKATRFKLEWPGPLLRW